MNTPNNQLSRVLQDAPGEVPSAGTSASLTYEPFYGLSEKPFSLSADPRFLFKSPAHAPAFDALLAGIRRREGLIVLTGEIGTGKTTLCRSVLQHLDRRTFAAFIPDPFVSREDLLKILLVDFGVISVAELRRGRLKRASRSDLSYLLYEFLDSLVPLQAFAVLIIDEAQNLPLPLLEEIRILSDLERREKLLQIVLVGQPELRASLKLPQMRQVEQRVSVRCMLTALDAEGVAGYVNHRLDVASDGWRRVEFTPASLDALYQGSAGVPRLINRICDRALQRACSSRSYRVDAKFVSEAIDELGLNPASGVQGWGRPREAAKVPDQPPPSKAPAIVSTVTEEDSALSDFAAESELSAARPASSGHSSTRHRRAGVAIAAFLAVAASLTGGVWYLRSHRLGSHVATATLPPLPPRPLLGHEITPRSTSDTVVSDRSPVDPAAPASIGGLREPNDYVIQVATFESPARAKRLVEELTSAGYRAREVELDLGAPRGRVLQVIVGGYSSAIEVARDLQRIRNLPGYSDARLLDR